MKNAVAARLGNRSKKDALLSLGKRLHHQLREKKSTKGKRARRDSEPEASALSCFLEDYPLLMMKEQRRAAKKNNGQ
jgi:hypothetical protein